MPSFFQNISFCLFTTCHCDSYGLHNKSITLLGHFTHLALGVKNAQHCVKLHKFTSHVLKPSSGGCLLCPRPTSTIQSMGCVRNTSYAHRTIGFTCWWLNPVYFSDLLRSQVAACLIDVVVPAADVTPSLSQGAGPV